MNISEVSKLLPICHRVNDALLIVGEAGMGKSHIVKEYAKTNNYHIEDLRLGNQEIGDLIGIPEISNGVTNWTEPIWLNRLKKAASEGRKCVLFLDEMNRAQQDVKASALQIVLDREIHQHKLPENTLVVAAINPDSSESGQEYQVDELDPALLDRFLQVKVSLDVNGWLQWARANKIHQTIIGFIAENPKFLYNVPKNSTSRLATPRSWASLSKYVDIFEEIDPTQRLDIITGKVGPELAVRFNLFYQEHNSRLSVDDIIDFVNDDKSKNIEETATKLAAFIESKTSEDLVVRELANQTLDRFSKYLSESKRTRIPKLRPFMALLYSLKLEILAGFMSDLKSSSQEKFLYLAQVDLEMNGDKKLFKKLLSKDYYNVK